MTPADLLIQQFAIIQRCYGLQALWIGLLIVPLLGS